LLKFIKNYKSYLIPNISKINNNLGSNSIYLNNFFNFKLNYANILYKITDINQILKLFIKILNKLYMTEDMLSNNIKKILNKFINNSKQNLYADTKNNTTNTKISEIVKLLENLIIKHNLIYFNNSNNNDSFIFNEIGIDKSTYDFFEELDFNNRKSLLKENLIITSTTKNINIFIENINIFINYFNNFIKNNNKILLNFEYADSVDFEDNLELEVKNLDDGYDDYLYLPNSEVNLRIFKFLLEYQLNDLDDFKTNLINFQFFKNKKYNIISIFLNNYRLISEIRSNIFYNTNSLFLIKKVYNFYYRKYLSNLSIKKYKNINYLEKSKNYKDYLLGLNFDNYYNKNYKKLIKIIN